MTIAAIQRVGIPKSHQANTTPYDKRSPVTLSSHVLCAMGPQTNKGPDKQLRDLGWFLKFLRVFPTC